MDRVRVAEVPEAGVYAGRVGLVVGESSLSGAPDEARAEHGPVVGAYVDGVPTSDLVYGLWFVETGEAAWFPPSLLERVEALDVAFEIYKPETS